MVLSYRAFDQPIIHIDATSANIENDCSPAVKLIGDIEEILGARDFSPTATLNLSTSFSLLSRARTNFIF